MCCTNPEDVFVRTYNLKSNYNLIDYLITNGIDVIQSDCAYNNLMAFPSVCGADTGEILVHEIPKQNVVDAEKSGFTNTNDISDDYSIYDCS